MEKIRVVLADDHSIVRNGIKSLLENEGEIEVVGEASNGKEALEICNSVHPDVLVMDIKMPEMNGIEATRLVPGVSKSTKVLILSMHDLDEYVLKSVEAGASGYLLKDASHEDFIKAIRKVSNNEKYFSSDIAHVFVNQYLGTPEPVKESKFRIEGLGITRREQQVLKYILDGFTNKEIADEIGKSVRTVETHRFNIMKKLNVHNATELIKAVGDYKL